MATNERPGVVGDDFDLGGLRKAVAKSNARLAAWKAATEAARGPTVGADGVTRWPVGRTVPKEVRELAAELLVTLGFPAAVECLVDPSASHMEKRAFVALLKDLGVGDAVSLARDATGEDVPGIAWLPVLEPRPVRPPGLDDDFADLGPAVPANNDAVDVAGELASLLDDRRNGRTNGTTKKNGNGHA